DCDVRRDRVSIKRKGALRGRLPSRERGIERIESVRRKQKLGYGQRAPRLRIASIELYCLLKRILCFEKAAASGGEQSQSAQIKFMRLRVVCAVDDERLPGPARELDAQFSRDGLGNFILNRKNVVELAIKFFGPRLQAVLHIN